MSNEFFPRGAEAGPLIAQGGQVVFDAASCGAAAITIQTVTINGADPGDICLFVPPAAGSSVAVQVGVGYCSAANTVKVPICNPTAGALDPASATYDYYLLKKPGTSTP